MDWIKTFGKKPSKTNGRCEIYYKDDWEVVFFEGRKRARLVKDDEIRIKSVEFDSDDELFNLFCHDPLFRSQVADKLSR